MLKLIKCEFWKLKRKRLLYALMSLSLFFPLILAYMAKAGTGADTTEHYLQTRFDYVYTMMLGYGLVFLLPCLIGIIAAILFFIERDCDTSKNLRTIPVTNTQLIMAKISMLFIFSIAFCLTKDILKMLLLWMPCCPVSVRNGSTGNWRRNMPHRSE